MMYQVLNADLQLIARLQFGDAPPMAKAVTPEGHDIETWTTAGVPALQGSETATGIDEQPLLVSPADEFWGLAFLEEVERREWTVQSLSMESVLKRNPYRDASGLFTTKERAAGRVGRTESRTPTPGWYKSFSGKHVEVGEGGMITSGSHSGLPADMSKFAVGPFASHAEAKAFTLSSMTASSAQAVGKPIPPAMTKPTPMVAAPVQPPPAPPKPVPIPPPPPAVPTPMVSPQVAKNLADANLNEFVGKQKLKEAQHNAVYNTEKSVGKSAIGGEMLAVNPKTGNVEAQFYHGYFSSAKAAQALETIKNDYVFKGFIVVPNALNPGEVSLTLKGSRVLVKSVHATKATPAPPVVSEKAKQPPVTVPQPAKPLTASQQTAKEKKQALQLEKYSAQYEKDYVERVVDALNLKAVGQNSKAKSKLAPLQTLEKTLVQYGITPENLKGLQEKLQMQVEQKAADNFKKVYDAHLESTRAQRVLEAANKTYDYQDPLYKVAATARTAFVQARDSNPGLLQKKGGQTEVSAQVMTRLEHEKFKTLQEIVQTKPGTTQHAIALDMAKHWGATPAEIAAAKSQPDLKAVLAQPVKTFDSVTAAAAQLKDIGVAYHVNKEEYDYYAPKEKQDQVNAKNAVAQAKYDLAKAAYLQSGGNVTDLSKTLKTIESEAQAQKYAAKKAKQAAQKQMQTDLQKASYEYMKSHFEHGGTSVQAIAAQKKLEDQKVAAKSLLSTDYDVDASVLNGKNEWDQTIKTFKDTATLKVKSAIYEYEYAVLNNAPAEKIAELKLQMEHAKTSENKYFPKAEMESMQTEQKSVAKAQKEANDRLKSLGANIQTKLKTHDANDADFKYPVSEGSQAKSTSFANAQKAQLPKLTTTEKDYLRSYTGSSFTELNRAAGAFGSTGKVPDSHIRTNMEKMDSAMGKITLGENVRLNRAMAQKYLANAFGLGDSLNHLTEKQLQDLVGKTYTEGAYGSTSMKPGWSSSMASTASKTGKALLKIRAGKEIHGIRVASFSQHSSEGEVILARGTTYVIRSIKKVGNSVELEVDIVGQIPKPLPGAKIIAPSVGA